MTKELKQEYTLRITQANKTQLITILYEMALLYVDEAEEALAAGDRTGMKDAVRRIQGCMCELMDSLHMEYEIAQNLLQLYLYINREVAKAALHSDAESLKHVRPVLDKLLAAYRQIEGQDTTGPVMGNAQTVYAGLTYGRNDLTESAADPAANRGFCI
ncbi:MAG: flagellar protein FliS [Lachnospiraceae bacterium]|nr:flagellar protein FliS [Lachnospiraceae bacterium]